MTLRKLRIRAKARLRSEWEQTAAIRATIYDMAQKKDDAPAAHQLPPQTFNPMSELR